MTRFDHIVCACIQGLLAQEGRGEVGMYKDPASFAQSVVRHADAVEAAIVEREKAQVVHATELVVSRVPSDPSDLEQRERMKPGTVKRIIDAMLHELRVEGTGFDADVFSQRFNISLEDTNVLRRASETERTSILRWLYRNSL